MNKFNSRMRDCRKDKRNRTRERKLQLAVQGKEVSNAPPPPPVSGKRKRKLEKRWRKAQKEALESGLVTLQDIEMIAADQGAGEMKMGEKRVEGCTGQASSTHHRKKKGFALRKRMRVRVAPALKKGGKTLVGRDAVTGEATENDKMME